MNESQALEVTAVRAIETADRERMAWTDADRAWASHAAAAAVGEAAPPDQFLAQRARLALERLHDRYPSLRQAVEAFGWQPWLAHAVVGAAFLAGLLADRVGDSQRINVLAPPVLLLLLWNLLVYAMMVFVKLPRRAVPVRPYALRAALARLGSGWRAGRTRLDAPVGPWLAGLAADWARLAAPLYLARSARVLHLAAAALALGVMGGLYLRGMGLEYRATWESTFLDAATVRSLLAAVFAPGAWLAGWPLPDLEQVRAMRSPGSENAATWLHLMALTMLVLVVAPRLVLAGFSWSLEWRRARAVPLPMEQPYFRRLLRGFHVAPTRVQVLPYGYTPATTSIGGLQAILARLLGGDASVRLQAPAAYGEEDDTMARRLSAEPGPVVVLFNLAATPEREAHGAFAEAVARRLTPEQPLLVLVDETSFRARAADDPQRLEQRRVAWRELLGAVHLAPEFVDLSAPDLAAADAALDTALYRSRS